MTTELKLILNVPIRTYHPPEPRQRWCGVLGHAWGRGSLERTVAQTEPAVAWKQSPRLPAAGRGNPAHSGRHGRSCSTGRWGHQSHSLANRSVMEAVPVGRRMTGAVRATSDKEHLMLARKMVEVDSPCGHAANSRPQKARNPSCASSPPGGS